MHDPVVVGVDGWVGELGFQEGQPDTLGQGAERFWVLATLLAHLVVGGEQELLVGRRGHLLGVPVPLDETAEGFSC